MKGRERGRRTDSAHTACFGGIALINFHNMPKGGLKEEHMASMMQGTAPTLPAEDAGVMALVCTLYEQGARAECLRLLLRLSAVGKRTAPLLYNMALCLEQAGQEERALTCLEKALACLRGGKKPPAGPPGEEDALRILHEQQCAQARYRFPMREEEAVSLPEYARERILRLMIDLCARRHDGARVRSLSASLPGKRFDNVEKALEQTAKKET